MRFDEPPIEGRLVRRYKRFFTDVELPDGEVVTAHCPNTGSMKGCLDEGNPVWLRDSKNDKRKLRLTFQAIQVGGAWVNVDTGLPNRVVYEALAAGEVPELTGYDDVRREVKYGTNSRIDVLLESEGRPPCYVEVKNTTLAEGDQARFPDAVTERGRKHLGELAEVVRNGGRAVQFFFVSRADVTRFAPADDIDPAYGAALREAADASVELLAYSAAVTADGLELGERLPVELPDFTPPPPKKRRRPRAKA
jgi:sugar fermentation stimulation protein A